MSLHRRVSVPIVNHGLVPNYRMLTVREGSHWVAMLLDHWLCAQGKTRFEAVTRLRGLATASHRFDWMRKCRPAPAEYQARYASRRLWTGSDHARERPRLVRIGTKRKTA